MADDWIVEVLTDLRAFAFQNGLHDLAAALDQTVPVARRDIEARTARVCASERNMPGTG